MPEIGWCAPIERAADLAAAGLDYHELQLVPLNLEDDAAFANAKARVRDLPLPVPVMSYLFPHDLRLVGEQIDEARARAYFERVVALMDAADTQLVVYGSGWARNVPEGFDPQRAEDQFLHALVWCAEALHAIGATLVIEPLNRKESNQCNSVADGVRLAHATGRGNVGSLADFYHVDEEHEPFDALREFGAALAHVHLADTGRLNPGSGGYDYAGFFGALKSAGYTGRMSGECGVKGEPVAAMRGSAAFLREAWAAALPAVPTSPAAWRPAM
jgi:sugar phosphate isomerase/epimerase